jgi:hypothetical protein
VQQFHNFAFIVISLAVMGYAASGVALSLDRITPQRHLLASAFSITSLLAYIVINYLPFDSFSIAWERSQIWILLLYFTTAGIPFLCAGWYIGLALRDAGEAAFRPYAANLIGASLGCLIALLCLQLSSEEGALGIAISLGFLTSVLLEPRRILRGVYLLSASMILLAFLWPIPGLRLNLSPYKSLSVAQQFPDARVMTTRRNASVRIDVLESSGIHSFPGLSLTSPAPDFKQLGLFIDGEGPYPLTNVDLDSSENLAFAHHMPGAIAYLLRPGAEVLIVDPGTALAAQVALSLGADRVSLPVDQPLITSLLAEDFNTVSGDVFNHWRIQHIPRASRGALSLEETQYTIVEWALSDPYRPITSGAFSLTENYLLTREAFEAGWNRLSPEGLMLITRWIGTPPSEATRIWSTVIQALQRRGLNDPAPHLVAFRGMRTSTILVSKQPFSEVDLAEIREFLVRNGFDPIYLPDILEAEVNQYNQLPEPVYFHLYKDLLDAPDATIRDYEFRLEPATDDRPYFFHFFRWAQSSQVLATLGVIWQPFGGSGYFVLLAMLALILLLATPLVLLPWISLRRHPQKSLPPYWVWLYFGGLGAGFMLVEIPIIMRMNLLLDYPVLTFGLVLFTLLLSSGIGSLQSRHISVKSGLAILLVLHLVNIVFLPVVISRALTLPLIARALIAVLWLTPTGFLMGIPFAAGMRVLESRTPGLIPWAWAINGAVSGLAGVLASLALLDIGFQLTLGVGVLCYLIVFVSSRYWG